MLIDRIPAARRIDIGKRAGVTAGVLGVLCVLAELCFMFPHILVSNDMRPIYAEHIGIFRRVLQVAIVATFLLGAISISFIRSKTFGAMGISLALIATLMGGSTVEPLTHDARPLAAGLDYFGWSSPDPALLFIPDVNGPGARTSGRRSSARAGRPTSSTSS